MTDNRLATVSSHTAFVLGNGPSLRGTDFESFSGFPTIGLNAAYRYWRTINWRPTYYACLDEVVGLSHKDAIAELISENRIETFLLRGNLIAALGTVAQTRKVLNFDSLRSRHPLLNPPTITTGSHAALWMASLGFDQIVLLGIDGQYKELVDGSERREGIELEIIETQATNPNYFFDDYQQTGDRYNVPNPRPGLHVEAWHAAARKLNTAGVTVLNANERSEVAVFPYIRISDFLADGSAITPPREPIAMARKPPVGHKPAGGNAGAKAKFSRFFGAQSGGLALAGTLIWGGFALGGYLANWQTVPLLLGFLASGLLFALSALLLYTRFVVAEHLAELQAMQDSLAERMADMERLREL